MTDVFDDLAAEHLELRRFVGGRGLAQWAAPTPAAGWTVQHQIAHLCLFDQIGLDCVVGDGALLDELLDRRGPRATPEFSTAILGPLLALPPAALVAQWRTANADLVDALRAAPATTRVPWIANTMSIKSMASARLMECWAHGLDCSAALGGPPTDTARLWHVCDLGFRALPYAFTRAQVALDGPVDIRENLRLELTSPDGQPWRFGPADANSVISGPAGQWARLVVRRITRSEASDLRADGTVAVAALTVAQAYV